MCSYQVWVKSGCPDSLVQSASSQELLLQTLYLPYMSYSHCHVWMPCFVPMMRLEVSGGALAWHRPPFEGGGVCSQSFIHSLTHLPFLELRIIAPIACLHEVFPPNSQKQFLRCWPSSRSQAGWLQDALLSSEVPAGPGPSSHHRCWHRGDYWGGKRGTGL